MRDFAEMVALEIRNTTELEAQVNGKQMPDGTERFGVTVKEKDANIAPSIYVEDMKEQGLTVEEAAAEVLKLYEQYKAPNVNVEWFMDFEQVKEKLFVKMLPQTFKTEVSRSAKAYGFEDLILVPYVKTEFNGFKGTILVKAEHIEKWGTTKRAVLDKAIANTKKEDVFIQSMASFMEETLGEDMGLPDDIYGPLIITNKEKIFGASAILARVKELKERFTNGFFVIPSSVHELLIIPKEMGMTEEAITAMVGQVNESVLVPEEVLSNHAYTF
jgi:hypothetical protein